METPDDDSGSRRSDGPVQEAESACHGSGGSSRSYAAISRTRAHDPHDVLSREQLGWLMATIETDVVPRLVDAHRRMDNTEAIEELHPPRLPDGTVERLVEYVLHERHREALAWIEGIIDAGTSAEAVYLGMLGPAARRLGEMWEADTVDFTQVTISLWRLQEIMYDLHAAFLDDATAPLQVHRILLAPSPGSHHTFGMLMVAEFFRRAGWAVWADPSAGEREVIRAARNSWFDVIGISVGVEEHLPLVTSTVRALRKASRNPDTIIMLGGPVIVAHPEYVGMVGADTMATDAANAVDMAQYLVRGPRQGRMQSN
jgi:methylmalonyl-CoA mutase cobalamin-binding domain/chain